MQDWLGIARGLHPPLEYKITGRLKRDPLKSRCHRAVIRIIRVLPVHNGGHLLHDLHHLRLAHDAMMKPVRQRLRGNPTGRPVLHKTHIMNIRHLGTSHTLINPTHHIAKNALCVVLNLLLDIRIRKVLAAHDRNRKQIIQRATRPACLDLALTCENINLVVMRRVQRRRRRARHPCAIGTGFRMPDLLVEHSRHHIRHRPHALADLCLALKPTGKPDIHVAILIRDNPRRGFHLPLAQERPRLHRGVNFVTRAIKEPGVDKRHPLFRRPDTFLEVDTRAPLLIHDPDLDRMTRQAKRLFHHVENPVGKGNFLRPMHLRLHNINRPM